MKFISYLLIALFTLSACADYSSSQEEKKLSDGIDASELKISLYENSGAEIDLSRGITGSGAVSYFITGHPAHGTLTRLSVSCFRYVPAQNFSGEDSFSYKITNGGIDGAEARAVMNVISANHPPAGNNLSAAARAGIPVEIQMTGTDIDGDEVGYFITAYPANGTLVHEGENPGAVYISHAGFTGYDFFAYRVFDGEDFSGVYVVSVAVGPFNQSPAAAGLLLGCQEDGFASGRFSAVDAEGDQLVFTVDSYPANGTVEISGEDFIYTPDENFSGRDFFTYRAADEFSSGGSAVVELVVSAVNDAPVAVNRTIAAVRNQESPVEFFLEGADADGDFLNFSVAGNIPEGLFIGENNHLSYIPPRGFAGIAEINFQVSDGVLFSEGSVRIAVRPAGVWFVSGTSSGGSDGLTWDTAFHNLADAVSASSEGDEIWIRNGTYTAEQILNGSYVYLKKNSAVRGGFTGTEYDLTDRAPLIPGGTVFDAGNLKGRFAAAGDGVLIEGLSVINFNSASGSGGAVFIPADASVRFNEMVFDGSKAAEGGAVFVSHGAALYITGSVFRNNLSGSGGAVYAAENSHVSSSSSVYSGNKSDDAGGALCLQGSSSVSRDLFAANEASRGGAMYEGAGTAMIVDTVFDGNSAESGGGIYTAGSLSATGSADAGNIFRNNRSGSGAAVYCDSNGNLGSRVVNISVSAFHANTGGDIIFSRRGDLKIENSYFCNNDSGWILINTGYGRAEMSNVNAAMNSGGGIFSSVYSGSYIMNSNFMNASPASELSGFSRIYIAQTVLTSSPVKNSSGCETRLTNCLLTGCAGAPLVMNGGKITAYNVTFGGSTAGINISGGEASFVNSIFWNEQIDGVISKEINSGAEAGVSVRYSLVQGGYPGEGNSSGAEYMTGTCGTSVRGPFGEAAGTYCLDSSVRSFPVQQDDAVLCSPNPLFKNICIDGGDPGTPEDILSIVLSKGAVCGIHEDAGAADIGYHGEQGDGALILSD